MTPEALDALVEGVARGDRRSLAKAITLVESTRADHRVFAQDVLERLLPRTGKGARIGITGVPGVGKSTFIETFGLFLVERGHRVAVLAVDPTSSLSGGSILGDKTRMPELAVSEGAFIRPSPARGSLGGVAAHTREALLLCEAAGYDVVLVETVGVGQSEYVVASMVDFFLLLLLPGGGDELQGIKRGILELADGVAVNKADGESRSLAGRTVAEYQGALHLMRGGGTGWEPPVIEVSALERRGVDTVWAMIEKHHAELGARGDLERKRADQRHHWFKGLLDAGVRAHFLDRRDVVLALVQAERDIDAQRITPTAAALRVLALLDR
ncbi:MAG TPA: methylmalonyl Co-A mutase-associated GTPase MeaB [Polyangiaceae bacterium]|nr:methylmalonyl Co-A mutase-associated GTPase MeaB [Polyangiaceae bacterium]